MKKQTKKTNSLALAKKIASIAGDRKAIDVKVLDLRKLSSFADFFVVCSGNSDRQVQAISGTVRDTLKTKGVFPLSEEGVNNGRWALIDYGDIVVHIFQPEERENYQLEKFWCDAPRVALKV